MSIAFSCRPSGAPKAMNTKRSRSYVFLSLETFVRVLDYISASVAGPL